MIPLSGVGFSEQQLLASLMMMRSRTIGGVVKRDMNHAAIEGPSGLVFAAAVGEQKHPSRGHRQLGCHQQQQSDQREQPRACGPRSAATCT